ncbi:hypothetical protein F5I97DRAFT_1809501 [Phlebopus sp. FC_14]|nr:hypothetical protein F5I97DRAFT_1809501 [Phlebopus sp. FC_14]
MAASNALWGYLLRKDLPEQESVSKIPPLAPVDKTGTSIRMLVHDTQANLEKFSGRVDGLLSRVDDCKSQVVNATNLLEAERDRLLAEMLDMANRCQSELKSHVGTPAQVQALDVLQISQLSTEKSVQALEKRIDALQGVSLMKL